MPSTFQILGSSSSGNSALLDTGHTKVLIDVGFSAKRLVDFLEEMGTPIDQIDAIFLTHEHNDHAQGMRGLAKRANLPIFANRDTAEAIQTKLCKQPNWQLFQTGTAFKFRDLTVRSFSVPHDAYDPVGFTFSWGEPGDLFSPPESLAWVTDLGYVPEHVRAHLREVDTLVIEANYDEALLEGDDRRPWSLKQRIRGRHGHLSNRDTFELLQQLIPEGRLKKIFLAHLSKDCNRVEILRKQFASLIDSKPISIDVVDPQYGITTAKTLTKPTIST
jgi:phosphoribosyl 1,2-cyclic phosphodiesterase